MGKSVHDDVLDAALNEIADNGDIMFLCSAQPTTYAQASATYKLGEHAMTEGDGNGDYTIANGDAGGRKLTVTAQADVSASADGTVNHVAICDSVAEKVLLVVTLSASKTVSNGDTVSVSAIVYTTGDPT